MRRVLLLLAVVGCRRAGETTTRPLVPLDETAPAPAAPPQPPVELPAPAEIVELDGKAPTSAPFGEPVLLTYAAPAPGALRVRTLTTVSVEQRADHVQISRYGYRLTEIAAQLEGDKIAVLRVTAHDAREIIELDGTPHEQKLLWGTYDVDLTRDFAARRDHQDVGTREQEELAVVLGLDEGNEGGMHKVARKHALRTGESIKLTDSEKELYAGGPAVSDPIALTLVGVEGDIVTLRIDATVDRGRGSTIKHREIDRYRLATGALVDKSLDTESVDSGVVTRSHTHQSLDTSRW